MKEANNLIRPYRILLEEVYFHIRPGLVLSAFFIMLIEQIIQSIRIICVSALDVFKDRHLLHLPTLILLS